MVDSGRDLRKQEWEVGEGKEGKDSIPRCFTKRKENACPHKYVNNHSGFTHKSQSWK